MISGKDLRLLRLSSGQSQSQLAEKINEIHKKENPLSKGGYDSRVVGAIENGRRNFGIALLSEWAESCGYDVSISFVKSGTIDNDKVLETSEADFESSEESHNGI